MKSQLEMDGWGKLSSFVPIRHYTTTTAVYEEAFFDFTAYFKSSQLFPRQQNVGMAKVKLADT